MVLIQLEDCANNRLRIDEISPGTPPYLPRETACLQIALDLLQSARAPGSGRWPAECPGGEI